MKVFMKKGEHQSLVFGIVFTLLFLFVSIYLLYSYFVSECFLDTFSQDGTKFVFGIFFSFFDLIFLIYLFKSPKKYTAVLISKSIME